MIEHWSRSGGGGGGQLSHTFPPPLRPRGGVILG